MIKIAALSDKCKMGFPLNNYCLVIFALFTFSVPVLFDSFEQTYFFFSKALRNFLKLDVQDTKISSKNHHNFFHNIIFSFLL